LHVFNSEDSQKENGQELPFPKEPTKNQNPKNISEFIFTHYQEGNVMNKEVPENLENQDDMKELKLHCPSNAFPSLCSYHLFLK